MERITILGSESNFYKGNTHFHTFFSDGAEDMPDVIEKYKNKGYDFLAYSDHDIYLDDEQYDTPTFITLGGVERGGLNPTVEINDNPGFHFGCIRDYNSDKEKTYADRQPIPDHMDWIGDETVQNCIDDMEEHGNLVVLNHPEWHMTPFEVMEKYDFFAVEIYNFATEWTTATSYGTAYWDYAMQHDKKLFAIASDDSHDFGDRGDRGGVKAFGGGFIVVNSNELSKKAISSNLKKGNFYSSSGPEIYNIYVEDGFMHVECSEVQFIMFKCWPERGEFIFDNQDSKPITKASQRIGIHMKYIRVECIDASGNVAWSNPFWPEDYL